MRFASIDIGTNSMRLLIADYEEQFFNREKFVCITRMGDDVDLSGQLSDEAIERNLKSFKNFTKQAKNARVNEIYAMGTSALRDSKNNHTFIERAKKETGVDVEIIKGDEEACLGFWGVSAGVCVNGNILIIDIGGGSTELVIGSESNGILYAKSINIGALRLTEKFVRHDPPSESDLRSMREFVEFQIVPEINLIKCFDISTVIGIGGTATTLSAIAQKLDVYDTNKVHNSKITKEEVNIVLNMLLVMTQEQRIKLAGLQPQRADIITAGIVILDELVEKLSLEKIIISEYDNLEGLIYKKIIEKSKN